VSVKFQKLVVATAVLFIAVFVAAGCGGNAAGGAGTELAQEQELVANMGEEAEAGLFIPAGMSSLDAINAKGYMQFAGLYRIDGEDSEIVPHLATGEPEISDDGLTYTIEMRDDAEWSDGEPITAENVITAVRWSLDPENGAYFGEFLDGIVGARALLDGEDDGPELGMRAIDDHTLEITLARQVPWFTQLLSIQNFYPMRADQLEELGEEYGQSTETAVSGPFKLTEYRPGDRIVYEKNDSYFLADDVTLEQITLRMISEATTAAAEFERGRLDTGLQNVMYAAAEVDKWKGEDTFVSTETVGSQYAYFNTSTPQLSDPKVRQAIALAINRKDIVENITKKGDVPTNTIVPPAVPGSDVWGEGAQDFLSPDGSPNLQKARDLLEEAGWNEDTELTVIFANDGGNAQAIAEQLQANLAEVGVNLRLNGMGSDVFFTEGNVISPIRDGVHIILVGWIQDYLDAQNWYQLFTSSNIQNGLNSAMYESDEFDEIYAEAIETVDDESRFDLYRQLEAKLTGPDGDMPAAPLYVQADATLVQPWVRGFELIPSGIIYWENIEMLERE
jgi:oligopeptide transport system substrate-binding protein